MHRIKGYSMQGKSQQIRLAPDSELDSWRCPTAGLNGLWMTRVSQVLIAVIENLAEILTEDADPQRCERIGIGATGVL